MESRMDALKRTNLFVVDWTQTDRVVALPSPLPTVAPAPTRRRVQ
ncbi:MAG: hypothetical protein R2851_04330 [Caldilineaceae bacterium]